MNAGWKLKTLRIAIHIMVFLTGFLFSIRPAWQVMEKWQTRAASLNSASYFYVVAKACDGTERFIIDRLGKDHVNDCNFAKQASPDSPTSVLVTEFSPEDVNKINEDLSATVSQDGYKYEYFVVIKRGSDYTDVSLETPTKGDYWRKGWYRIESGQIRPQRICFYGPGWGLLMLPMMLAAGVIVLWFYRLLEKYVRAKWTMRKARVC